MWTISSVSVEALAHRDAQVAHFLRQLRQHGLDAVLHFDLGDVDVGAGLEGHRDRDMRPSPVDEDDMYIMF